MFENVNYTYYSSTMGRAVVPSSAEFNRFKDNALAYMTPLVPFLIEREPGGLDKATCMVVEECYKADLAGVPDGGRVASESIDSYSRSFDISKAKSSDAQKEAWIFYYCMRKELR